MSSKKKHAARKRSDRRSDFGKTPVLLPQSSAGHANRGVRGWLCISDEIRHAYKMKKSRRGVLRTQNAICLVRYLSERNSKGNVDDLMEGKKWFDKLVPSLLENLTLGVSQQTDHLIGTSIHAPQGPRLRILSSGH
ncbi:hypothetical protein TNCV_1373101 [Trichonephila clavipes]|uniref:Uncharacterized protein n=1 Tax=Trichonephila clavipes TaxID=2585209 RepID=A0A8X6WHV7_TRICX|nr:hypothetical protein TNCV_1373101 [Trichonephila clavipes]